MREHRQSESRRKRRRQLAHICIFTLLQDFLFYGTITTPLTPLKPSPYHSLFSSPVPSLTSRSTSSLLLFVFNSSSSSFVSLFNESIRLITRMVFASSSSSIDSFLKTSAFNRSCLASLSRRDVENTTAENPIKNVDASESFCQFSLFENLGLLISLLHFWGSKRVGNSSLLLLFEVSCFLFRRSVTQRERERERVKKSTTRKERQRDREHVISGVLSEGFIKEREREEKSKGTN